MRQHYCVPSRRLAGYLSAEVARRKFIIACLRLAGLGGLPAGRTRAQLLPWSCRGNVAQVLSVKNVRRYTLEYYGIGYFTRSQGGLGVEGAMAYTGNLPREQCLVLWKRGLKHVGSRTKGTWFYFREFYVQ